MTRLTKEREAEIRDTMYGQSGASEVTELLDEIDSLRASLETATWALDRIAENDAAYGPMFHIAREALEKIKQGIEPK